MIAAAFSVYGTRKRSKEKKDSLNLDPNQFWSKHTKSHKNQEAEDTQYVRKFWVDQVLPKLNIVGQIRLRFNINFTSKPAEDAPTLRIYDNNILEFAFTSVQSLDIVATAQLKA